jgi:UDP-N-acetylglucosamine transferase subunit ALG13
MKETKDWRGVLSLQYVTTVSIMEAIAICNSMDVAIKAGGGIAEVIHQLQKTPILPSPHLGLADGIKVYSFEYEDCINSLIADIIVRVVVDRQPLNKAIIGAITKADILRAHKTTLVGSSMQLCTGMADHMMDYGLYPESDIKPVSVPKVESLVDAYPWAKKIRSPDGVFPVDLAQWVITISGHLNREGQFSEDLWTYLYHKSVFGTLNDPMNFSRQYHHHVDDFKYLIQMTRPLASEWA